jgi:hypothetical protein
VELGRRYDVPVLKIKAGKIFRSELERALAQTHFTPEEV